MMRASGDLRVCSLSELQSCAGDVYRRWESEKGVERKFTSLFRKSEKRLCPLSEFGTKVRI